MNTYLGVSSLLCVDDLDEQVIADGTVLYMEGYLFDRDEAKEAFRRAAEVAHANGRMVSLTLSDSFCVDRHRDDFRALVHDEVDLLFGNEDELLSLYEVDSFDDAVDALRRGVRARRDHGRGRRVASSSRPTSCSRVPAEPVDQGARHHRRRRPVRRRVPVRLDTGPRPRDVRSLGSIAAAEVISHVGPRPLVELRNLIGHG